ncbi:hypothetical protein ACFQNE_16495 [Gordonia phosphorivorans]|uniref:Uncharacterized protein n=1 Tax=Gordonia phosphorivorans TaxID=1056982 RepID=A0ABV6HBX6_9ACTN
MANLFSTIRGKLPSKRAMMAIGGASALAVVGVVQTTATLAGTTDETTAQVSQIASQNFFPTPLVDLTCKTDYDAGKANTAALFSWPAIAGMKYRVLVLRNNNPSNVRADFFTTDTSYRYRASSAGDDRVRVYTVNVASGATDATRIMSSGYLSWSVYASSGVYTKCSSKFTDAPNVDAWEDSAAWEPQKNYSRNTQNRAFDPSKSAGETALPSKSEEPSMSPEPSASEAPSSAEAPPSSEAPSTSEAPSATSPAESQAEPTITIAIRVSGDRRELGVFHDGGTDPVCSVPLEEGDRPAVGNNKVSIQNGNSVYEVDTTTCAKK